MVPPEVKSPAEIFHTHLVAETLTRDLAVSCLQDAFHWNQADSQIGESAIKWLWDRYDSIGYPDDVDLINPIAVLLVREGKEELLWNWISQESRKPAGTSKHFAFDRRYDWRTAAFRGLVEAKTHLATDKSLDAALEILFRGTRVPYYLSVQSASNFCQRMLCTPELQGPGRSYEQMRSSLRFSNTSMTLWNVFYDWMGQRPKYFAAQHQGIMMLHHPQRPNPWPYCKWWRAASQDQKHPLHHIKSLKSMVSFVEQSRELRIVLKHFGHHEEADWPKAFTLEVFPRNK